ncbi:hypothetical protein [Streptomyces sulphureus]|uniref:hypothetical protein n=1 Tax=Streptomyces sulphureus TaxID=47758 RepID=UPI001FDF018F|nr:hypothetical protein [Streptomyces sulphureus]
MSGGRLMGDQAVRSGAMALGAAGDGVQKIRNNVQSVVLGVNGDEGQAFRNLFNAWDRQAQEIIKQINTMTQELEKNHAAARNLSQDHQARIQQHTNLTAENIFSSLT